MPSIQRLRTCFALLVSTLLASALLVGLPVSTVLGPPAQVAEAAVAAGDLVFEQMQTGSPGYPSTLQQRSSAAVLTNLSTGSGSLDDHSPDVSPDGSRVAFIGSRPNLDNPSTSSLVLMTMNSDGSGQQTLVTPMASANEGDEAPRWSPDGTKVLYTTADSFGRRVGVRNSDGGGYASLTTGGVELNAAWSPDGTKIAFERLTPGSGFGQIWVMNANGTGQRSVVATDSGYSDGGPVWASTNVIYFTSSEGGGSVRKYTSTNGFTSGSATRGSVGTVSGIPGQPLKLSGDGTKLAYATTDSSGCSQVYTMLISTGAATKVTNTGCTYQNYAPTFVKAAWPPAPPSNATVAINAPSSSDAPYTRQITIGLSTTGVSKFQYGWSPTNTTAPASTTLQEVPVATTPKVVNYLGKWNGSAWVTGSGTQPDSDWYLWVRSVQTGGTANAWGTPLKVHTPRAPVWVSVGDSYSSGHHQDGDEYWCPNAEDGASFPGTPGCGIAGAPHLTPNDEVFSWITEATNQFNNLVHAPTAWRIGRLMAARSGTKTYEFGNASYTPGTAAWASGNYQAAQMRAALYARPDSWNVVSQTGGANDADFAGRLSEWYRDPIRFGLHPVPWGLTGTSPTSNCPNSQTVWSVLVDSGGGSGTSIDIKRNLQAIKDIATTASQSVRVLSVGYPYIMDPLVGSSNNECYADSGAWHGTKSVVDELNANVNSVTGDKFVSLASALGPSPVAAGYIQLTRLYGYPHPSSAGQTQIATTAAIAAASAW